MISIRRSHQSQTWTLFWRDVAIAGTTRPFGVFVGTKDRRTIICLLRTGDNQLHIGVMFPDGRNRLFL